MACGLRAVANVHRTEKTHWYSTIYSILVRCAVKINIASWEYHCGEVAETVCRGQADYLTLTGSLSKTDSQCYVGK